MSFFLLTQNMDPMMRWTSADAVKFQNTIDSFDSSQHVPLTPTHRDGDTLDLVLTKSEQDLDDVNVDTSNILFDHSIISWRLRLTHQPSIIADREVTSWKRVEKDKFREALLQSELCKPISVQIPLKNTSKFTTTLSCLLQTSLRRCSESSYDASDSRSEWTSSALHYVERLECWNVDMSEHKKCEDRVAWVEHERKRQKESIVWSMRLLQQKDQPRKLWRSLATMMGSNNSMKLSSACPSAKPGPDKIYPDKIYPDKIYRTKCTRTKYTGQYIPEKICQTKYTEQNKPDKTYPDKTYRTKYLGHNVPG